METCRHYWLLSAPQTDIVVGRCKLCHAERIFPARLEDTDRGNDYMDLRESGNASPLPAAISVAS